MGLTDITGVVVYQCVCRIILTSTCINIHLYFFRFGFFYVLPLTAPKVISTPDPTIAPASFNMTDLWRL